MPLTGSFQDYQSAAKACGPRGYEDADLIEVVRAKTRQFIPRLQGAGGRRELTESELFVVWAALAAAGGAAVRVLDFGGACGTHFHVADAAYAGRIRFDWTVLETPAMVEAAREFKAPGLAFYSQIAELPDLQSGPPDLLLCSSSLQYVPQPLDVFDQLLSLRPRYVCLTRMPIAPGHGLVFSVQRSRLSNNGPGRAPIPIADREMRYPIALISDEQLAGCWRKAYAPVAAYTERPVLYHANYGLIPFKSMLLQRV